MEVNVGQRVAGNAIEHAFQVVVFVLISGLFAPIPVSCAGGLYLVARQGYSAGFKSKAGPGGRGAFFGIIMLVELGLFISSLFFSLRMAGALASFGF